MDAALPKRPPRRRDDRVILHFDLDCFYAQCVENRQPSLKALPLGIKQKGILATCNYVARRHGVKKLMAIAEAKKICPDLVLADGEDLSPFRDVSKRLYALLRAYSWNGKIERLGLDEMFLDVTDVVSYNVELLNRNALPLSYFCLSRSNPELGFAFDATSFAGCVHGVGDGLSVSDGGFLRMRLLLASHLAQYLRLKIEEEGYTTACGISTNKVLAKLAGDKHKPRNQTTLLALRQEDVSLFMDPHPLRKVPGIGSKITRVLEGFVLGKEPDPDVHSMECSTAVGQVRTHPAISPPTLERLLSGPGSEKGLGAKVWALLHGVDDSEVKPARDVPTQISIEDTYKGLTSSSEIHRALLAVTTSLLRRMQNDLLDDEDHHRPSLTAPPGSGSSPPGRKKWLARPRTIRLTTRPYTLPSENKPYNYARASRSCPLPSFVFSLADTTRTTTTISTTTTVTKPSTLNANNSTTNTTTNINMSPPSPPAPSTETQPQTNTETEITHLASRLVAETLLPLFNKLNGPPLSRPEGWNIGLINVCVTNMSEGPSAAGGGNIAAMLGRMQGRGQGQQQQGLATGDGREGVEGRGQYKKEEQGEGEEERMGEDVDERYGDGNGEWESDGDGGDDDEGYDYDDGHDDDGGTREGDLQRCPVCDRFVPRFAVAAHERYHAMEEDN